MSRALFWLGGLGALALLASRARAEDAEPIDEPPLPDPVRPEETLDPQGPPPGGPPPPMTDGERGDPDCGGQRPVADPKLEEALQAVPAPYRCDMRTRIAEGGNAWRGAAESLAITLGFAGLTDVAEALRVLAKSGTGYAPPAPHDPECGGQDLIPGAEPALMQLPPPWRCHARDLIADDPNWRETLEQRAYEAESMGLHGIAAALRAVVAAEPTG